MLTEIEFSVIGDILIDRNWSGKSLQISNEAPIPIVSIEHIEERFRGATNIAFLLSKYNFKISVTGFVGIDDISNNIHAKLLTQNITCNFIKDKHIKNYSNLYIYSSKQCLLHITFEGNHCNWKVSKLNLDLIQITSKSKAVILIAESQNSYLDIKSIINCIGQNNKLILGVSYINLIENFAGSTILFTSSKALSNSINFNNKDHNLYSYLLHYNKIYNINSIIFIHNNEELILIEDGRLKVLDITPELFGNKFNTDVFIVHFLYLHTVRKKSIFEALFLSRELMSDSRG
jgi:bifunctional ADP-heptose synthase (sugar kinase/adenylyltransferase)